MKTQQAVSLPAVRCVVVVAVGLVVGLHVFGGWPSLHLNVYRLDLDVYRIGAQRWLHGWPLYDLFPVTRVGPPLSFTYPPVAAVLFSPLVVLPLGVDSALITLVSVVLLGVAIWVVLQAQGYPHRWWWVVAAMPVALLLEPVAKTLQLGQINLLLLTAMLADSLVKRALWPRGLLTGLAAAVKLTPLVGLLFFFLRGDRKAVRNGVLSFACATGAGALLAPRESLRYWTSTVFAVNRIGDPIRAETQNLRAVMIRLGLAGPVGTAVWAVVAAAVLALGAVAARKALRAKQPGLALVLVAIAGVIASPMSWSHHWVWCVPALLILADLGRHHWMPRWLAITGVLLFLVPPQGLLPHGAGAEHGWALWQQMAGAGYVCWALLLLCAAAAAPDQWSTPARDSEPARSTA
jgi:alpha-1,2-mannosyltransferase